jgi:hypothetical protein
MKTFLQKNIKSIKVIKTTIAVMLGIMIVIDIVLVMLEKREYPTFSWVVRDHRPRLIWLTFLFGGLVAKVFYNRKSPEKQKEMTGFLAFMSVVSMLLVLGYHLGPLSYSDEFIIMVCGTVVAYRIWPQYEALRPDTNKGSVTPVNKPIS